MRRGPAEGLRLARVLRGQSVHCSTGTVRVANDNATVANGAPQSGQNRLPLPDCEPQDEHAAISGIIARNFRELKRGKFRRDY